MWDTINRFLQSVDDFVWGPPLMVLILAGGIYLTVRMGILQIRKLPLALKWCNLLEYLTQRDIQCEFNRV